jgi:hypothetical protein
VTSPTHASYAEQHEFAVHVAQSLRPTSPLQTVTATAAQTPLFASTSQMQVTPAEQSDAVVHRLKQAFTTVPVGSGRQAPPLAQSAPELHDDEQTPGRASKFAANGRQTPARQSADDWQGSPSSPFDPPPPAPEHAATALQHIALAKAAPSPRQPNDRPRPLRGMVGVRRIVRVRL